METTLSPIYLLPIPLIMVVVVLIIFTIYMVLGGGNRLKNKRRDETSPRFLGEKTPILLAWEPVKALQDLSSLCVRTGESSGIGNWSHCRGTMQSLSRRRDAWLAFTVNTYKREGSIVVRTSMNTLIVKVSRDSLPGGRRQAEVMIDGLVFGRMNIETREFFDQAGQRVGRLTGGKTIIMQGMTNYVTVEMHGQDIAEMNTEPFSWFERIMPIPPVFKLYRHHLTADEGWWLIALFALALYRDCLNTSV